MRQKVRRRYQIGVDWRALRLAVFERDGWRCALCRERKPLQAHHILPRSAGGKNVVENLASLCNDCHEPLGTGGKWKAVADRLRAAIGGPHEPT